MNDKMPQEDINRTIKESSEQTGTDLNSGGYKYLTIEEADTLGEVSNIFMGSASTTLSMLLGSKVEITIPEVLEYAKIEDSFVVHENHLVVSINYLEGLEGATVLALKIKDSAIIANLMMGGDGKIEQAEIGELELSAVSEAMNQMVGTASTSLSSMFNCPINISLPTITFSKKDSQLELPEDILNIPVIAIKFKLIIGDLINSEIIQIISVDDAKLQVLRIMKMMSEVSQSVSKSVGPIKSIAETAVNAIPVPPQAVPTPQPKPAPQTQKTTPKPPIEETTQIPKAPQKQVTVQPVQFSSFDSLGNTHGEVNQNLNLVMDVKLELTVELGRTELPIKNVLEFTKGSIVELDKVAGEPVELFANGKLIARGEVVVIEDNFGLRITSIISPENRMKVL